MGGQSKKRYLHARLKLNFKELKCYNFSDIRRYRRADEIRTLQDRLIFSDPSVTKHHIKRYSVQEDDSEKVNQEVSDGEDFHHFLAKI